MIDPINPLPSKKKLDSVKLTTSNANHKALKQTAQHLKLIISNSGPLSAPALPDPSPDIADLAPFRVETQAYKPGRYIMTVRDASHSIACELMLKIRPAQQEQEFSTVVCQFPNIDHEKLSKLCWENETLFGILAIRFQMKILEQLMLFCADHLADTLVLIMDCDQAEELEIYGNCKMVQKKIPTPQGKKVQMTIAAEADQYDAWLELMEETKLKFGQTLWSEQRSNPAIKNYLKTHEVAGI